MTLALSHKVTIFFMLGIDVCLLSTDQVWFNGGLLNCKKYHKKKGKSKTNDSLWLNGFDFIYCEVMFLHDGDFS